MVILRFNYRTYLVVHIYFITVQWVVLLCFPSEQLLIYFLEIIIQTCPESIVGIVMPAMQHFVKNMEDKLVADVTKESFLKTLKSGYVDINRITEYYINGWWWKKTDGFNLILDFFIALGSDSRKLVLQLIEPRYNFLIFDRNLTWTPDIYLIHRLGHDIRLSLIVFDGGALRYPPCPDWNEMKVCFAEIRKRDGSVINVNMGCKQAKACETNHEMNFRDPNPWQQQVSQRYDSWS